jgi:hypothetical protein
LTLSAASAAGDTGEGREFRSKSQAVPKLQVYVSPIRSKKSKLKRLFTGVGMFIAISKKRRNFQL